MSDWRRVVGQPIGQELLALAQAHRVQCDDLLGREHRKSCHGTVDWVLQREFHEPGHVVSLIRHTCHPPRSDVVDASCSRGVFARRATRTWRCGVTIKRLAILAGDPTFQSPPMIPERHPPEKRAPLQRSFLCLLTAAGGYGANQVEIGQVVVHGMPGNSELEDCPSEGRAEAAISAFRMDGPITRNGRTHRALRETAIHIRDYNPRWPFGLRLSASSWSDNTVKSACYDRLHSARILRVSSSKKSRQVGHHTTKQPLSNLVARLCWYACLLCLPECVGRLCTASPLSCVSGFC